MTRFVNDMRLVSSINSLLNARSNCCKPFFAASQLVASCTAFCARYMFAPALLPLTAPVNTAISGDNKSAVKPAACIPSFVAPSIFRPSASAVLKSRCPRLRATASTISPSKLSGSNSIAVSVNGISACMRSA